MRDDIYVRLSRPEGYEDVHPDLVLEDARIEPAFEPVVVTDEIERLTRERDEARRALTRIAGVMGCQPDDDDDLVEAVRLLVSERDEARAEIERLRDEVAMVADGVVHVGTCDGETPPVCVRCQRDEALALLAECRAFIGGQPAYLGGLELHARLDAVLGGRDE